ncbi:MAG: gliding motility-associated C-terminal domain-containing protein [Ferruginibacter sp.]|nr:gliding motility-associated C-terminal domain-containing protein [Ferruginibacter sp.]
MKKNSIILLLFCCAAFKTIYAQNGCVDSITFSRFLSPYFGEQLLYSNTVKDNADNIYINGFGRPNRFNYNISKFNADNKLIWFKTFVFSILNPVNPNGLRSIDSKANLIFGGGEELLKFDSAANTVWGKKIQRSDFPLVQFKISNIITDESDNIFLYGFTGDDKEKTTIVKLNSVGNLQWSKKYGNINLPKFHSNIKYLVSQDANTIVLFNQFYYDADINDTTAKQGIQIVKINKADGSIMQQKTIMYYNDAAGAQQNDFTLVKVNYSKTTRTFVIDSWGQVLPPFFRAHILTTIDDNLNLVKTVLYNSANINPAEYIDISEGNNIVLAINQISSGSDTSNYFSFITIDDNLEIIKQRKINLTNLSVSSNLLIAKIIFKKNGILNFQINQPNSTIETNNPIYLFDNSPFYQNINSYCLGKDTAIYNKGVIYTLPVNNVSFSLIGDVPYTLTDIAPDPYKEEPFPKTEICKELSICDTIKLFGSTYHCLSSPLDSFKIIRNPLCKRVTNWQVDTNYIKVLGKTDTSLYVQYLKPYRGNIKVGFGGCSLTDAIPIEVYAPKTGINLGNDTMQCAGKSITLHTGGGFKNYIWQDGSTLDSLVTDGWGTYHVTATDSCGNIFRDTVHIKQFDVALQTDYPQEFCKYDTAFFILPGNLYNYTWQPTTATSLINNTWRLYPSVATIYSISGERMPGCILTDTVLINVKDCPIYIYFPTAFTPNNDGLNDKYKPLISGRILQYEFAIYNRYGQLVFKSNDPNEGWDGIFNNSGNPLPGSYVWICRYQFINQTEYQKKGMFTLIR